MSVSASKTVTINAPLDQVLATIRDVAGQTEWWPGTISAVVDTTDDAGLPARATLVNDVKVAKDEFQLDYEHSDTGMSWTLVAPSKAQKAQKGSWVLVDKGGATEATVSLDVDSSPVARLRAKKVIGDALKGATEGLLRTWVAEAPRTDRRRHRRGPPARSSRCPTAGRSGLGLRQRRCCRRDHARGQLGGVASAAPRAAHLGGCVHHRHQHRTAGRTWPHPIVLALTARHTAYWPDGEAATIRGARAADALYVQSSLGAPTWPALPMRHTMRTSRGGSRCTSNATGLHPRVGRTGDRVGRRGAGP